MSLIVEAKKRMGSFELDAAFASEGGVTALFGASGSGKTSLIRVVAGLARPDQGRLVIDGDILVDTQKRIFVPVHKRRFGYVFQEGRLLPHLSVRQNLLYGRWFAPQPKRADRHDHVIEMLGIGHLLDRRPANLSGGEKQRVAIGRALLSAPRMLLMDEPLAALDEQRKAEILPYLQRLREEAGLPILYVSHSLAEVTRLADRVVLMKAGRAVAVGRPAEVLGAGAAWGDRREAGVVLDGTVIARDEAYGLATIRLSGSEITVPGTSVAVGRMVRVHIPERDVLVATQRPEGLSALNVVEGRIDSLIEDGDGMVRVRLACGQDLLLARITAYSAERLALQPQMKAFAVIKTAALQI